jgi:hypothetical protein
MDIIVELRQRQIARLVKPRTELTFGESEPGSGRLERGVDHAGCAGAPPPPPAGRGQ